MFKKYLKINDQKIFEFNGQKYLKINGQNIFELKRSKNI